jgi:hypothetical protein
MLSDQNVTCYMKMVSKGMVITVGGIKYIIVPDLVYVSSSNV